MTFTLVACASGLLTRACTFFRCMSEEEGGWLFSCAPTVYKNIAPAGRIGCDSVWFKFRVPWCFSFLYVVDSLRHCSWGLRQIFAELCGPHEHLVLVLCHPVPHVRHVVSWNMVYEGLWDSQMSYVV